MFSRLFSQHQVPGTNIKTRMEDLIYPGVDAAVLEVKLSHCSCDLLTMTLLSTIDKMLTDKLCTHSAVTTSCAGSVQMFENSFRELPLGKNMVHILNLFSFRRWLWSRGRGWGKERSNRREWKERVREWIKTDQFEPVIMTPWIPAAVFLLPPPLDP